MAAALRWTALALATIGSLATASDEPPPVANPGLVEKVDVNLLILDVQVLDRKGNAVPGLVAGDFDVSIDNRAAPIATFDASCGELAEPPEIVLAFDYQHLDPIQRGIALESARRALEGRGAGGGRVMVAALTGGLRVEQPFTTDRARIPATLARMRDDPTLFAGNFSHTSDDGFVRGLTALFDVAAAVPRPKAIVLYSTMRDAPLDEDFRQLAALAAASRSVIYPVDVRGLDDSASARDRRTPRDALGSAPVGPVKIGIAEKTAAAPLSSSDPDSAMLFKNPRHAVGCG